MRLEASSPDETLGGRSENWLRFFVSVWVGESCGALNMAEGRIDCTCGPCAADGPLSEIHVRNICSTRIVCICFVEFVLLGAI